MVRRSPVLGAALVVALNFALLVPFSRLSVDPHHDGIMLHPALMIADGHVIHRDVFSQYGPLTSIVHALFVDLLGQRLWSIRLATTVFLAAAQGVLFLVNNRLFGPAKAYTAAFLSFCVTYFLSPGTPMHPWSSDLLLLVVANLSLLALLVHDATSPRRRLHLQIAVGLTSALVPFIRQSAGVALVLVLVLLVVMRQGRELWVAVIAFFAGLLMWSCYFLLTGSWRAFWNQSVVGPWRWAIDERGNTGWDSVRGNLLNQGLVGVAVVLALIKILDWVIEAQQSRTRRSVPLFAAIASITVIFLSVQENASVPFLNRESLLWAFGVAALLALFQKLILGVGRESFWTSQLDLSLLLLSLPIVTIFPVTDARHAYWAFVPLFGLGVHYLAEQFRSRSALMMGAALLCGLIGFQTLDNAWRTLKIERVSVPNTPVLENVLFDAEYHEFFRERFQTVSELQAVRPNLTVFNICSDGLFASLGAIEELPDPYFVSWNFGLDFFSDASEIANKRTRYINERRPIVWMCPLTEDPEVLASRYKLKLIPNNRTLPADGAHGWWPYVSYLGVPEEWSVQSGQEDGSR